MRRTSLIAGAVGGSLLIATAALAANGVVLPPGPNRALIYGKCQTCHDLQYLHESAGIPRSAWNDLLDSMKQYGLQVSADERAKILEYLGTYLGPNPPKASAAATAAPAKADGAAVFAAQCSACHQPKGQGVPGQFPPLAGNPDVFLSRDYPLHVILFGLSGKITVNGRHFNSVMPPLGEILSDAEIAAAVNYVRGAWGNDALRPKNMEPVDAGMVADLRAKKDSLVGKTFSYRQKLKAAAAKN